MGVSGGRILVIRGGAIGDFILTLPAIAALRRQFPDAHLAVLGYPHIAQLAVAGGLVDSVRFIEARPLAGFFARDGELALEMADYFAQFHLIVSYLYDPDGIFRDNVGRCTGAQFLACPHRPDERAGVHAAKVYLKPLEFLAIFDASPLPQLAFPPQTEACRQAQIALLPGSGSEAKNWPEASWAELIRGLAGSTAVDFLLVGGEAERARLQRLGALLPPGRFRVAQSVPLPELGALLQACAGFIGHDCGISHLAAAVGLPGIVLWGHTVEAVWRPPSERVLILRHAGGLGRLPVAEVLAQAQTMLAALAGGRMQPAGPVSPGNGGPGVFAE